jgi:indolepyruvate ferredoxin oxidoreductase beta subunit
MINLQNSRPVSIAVAAMGGQGGGVLSNWIVELAENNGYYAQVTSVPGVAQRTGATINYVEILPEAAAKAAGKDPVLALMPVPGDVDIVIAGELVEAGRAIQRGLVTPDRTTLIASSHRTYSYSEKSAMADGRVDSDELVKSAAAAAKSLYCFDMELIATEHKTLISAVLFGALAGSKVLEFSNEAFVETIRRGGKAVEASLAGFQAGAEAARSGEISIELPNVEDAVNADRQLHPKVRALLDRIRDEIPSEATQLATEGVRRLIDYQDPEYANAYLDCLARICTSEKSSVGSEPGWKLTAEAARHLALWMSYEDTIRVADLKTRSARFTRYRDEVSAETGQVVHVTEFMHPRVEEICDTLPNWLGNKIMETGFLHRTVAKLFSKPWKVKTSKLWGFLLLYPLGRMKILRRSSYRFKREEKNINDWLTLIEEAAKFDHNLALEIVLCQKLVKGYGDTHERGWRNYSAIMTAIHDNGLSSMNSNRIRSLREAALADEHGNALREELSKAA